MVKRNTQIVSTPGLKLKPRKRSSVARWVIAAVIVLAGMVVGLVAWYCVWYDEESIVMGDLDKLATSYYEEYTYPNLVEEGTGQEKIEELMDRYIERGFATVHLRQLLSHDEMATKVNARLIKKHCDVNKTTVKFYPEEPFDEKSYRMDWRYDCDF